MFWKENNSNFHTIPIINNSRYQFSTMWRVFTDYITYAPPALCLIIFSIKKSPFCRKPISNGPVVPNLWVWRIFKTTGNKSNPFFYLVMSEIQYFLTSNSCCLITTDFVNTQSIAFCTLQLDNSKRKIIPLWKFLSQFYTWVVDKFTLVNNCTFCIMCIIGHLPKWYVGFKYCVMGIYLVLTVCHHNWSSHHTRLNFLIIP